MDEKTWTQVVETRAADGRAIMLPYTTAVAASIAMLVFGDVSALSSSVRLALAAFVVLGSLWVIIWWDGIFQDFGALQKSVPEGVASTAFGAAMIKAPVAVFRVVNLLIIGLIGLATVLAIYD
ncbi:MAG: hypothetical protein ACO225_14530 [Ilumatobacteraceae bacterium]